MNRTDLTREDMALIERIISEKLTNHVYIYEGDEVEQVYNKVCNILNCRSHSTPYERTRAAVYATGNKWAIENFEAVNGRP